jgi:hypothetical protein
MTKKVPITLADGKVRNLLFNFNALAELTDKLGVDIIDLRSALTGPGALKGIRGILWAGLIHEDKALTLDAVGEMIELSKLNEITEAAVKAISLAFGEPDGGPKNPETPEATVPAPSL